MFDLAAFKKFLEPLGWFLTLGESDTRKVRAQLQDLLQHTGRSLQTLIELNLVLTPIEKSSFNKSTFGPVYLHCQAHLTSPEAAEKARSHCTDIARDVRRLNFITAKYLRTELSAQSEGWKGIDKAFRELMDADAAFLDKFSAELVRLGDRLKSIFDKVTSPLVTPDALNDAWREYESLRADLVQDHSSLKVERNRLLKAENHIRRVLT